MGKKIDDGKYKISKKAPAYLDGLNSFLDEGKSTNERMKNKSFLDNVKSTWPDFHRKYGRIAPVKTAAEKQEAKKERLEKFVEKNKAEFEAITKSGLAGDRLKEVAHRIAVAGNKKQKGADGKAAKRRRDEDDEDEQAEEEEEEGDEAEDEEGDEQEEENEQEQEEEEEGMEEDEQAEEEEEEEEEEYESEPKKPASPKKEKVIMEALSPNRRKMRKESIKQALQKKVPVKSLESMKTNFYSLLTEYGIGADENVAKLFERVYDTALEQNRALGSVETLIEDILE